MRVCVVVTHKQTDARAVTATSRGEEREQGRGVGGETEKQRSREAGRHTQTQRHTSACVCSPCLRHCVVFMAVANNRSSASGSDDSDYHDSLEMEFNLNAPETSHQPSTQADVVQAAVDNLLQDGEPPAAVKVRCTRSSKTHTW